MIVKSALFIVGREGVKSPWETTIYNKGIPPKSVVRRKYLRFDFAFKDRDKKEHIHIENEKTWY